MNWIDIIGLIGSISIGLSFIPQTYKTLKTNTIKSTSFLMFFITSTASVCMIIYSVYYKVLPMLIANVSVLTNSSIIMIAYLYKKKMLSLTEQQETNVEFIEYI
tara:strand:- start:489 stop:800 length:312 start_codon:yes stop_codon:yes gene_type:complete